MRKAVHIPLQRFMYTICAIVILVLSASSLLNHHHHKNNVNIPRILVQTYRYTTLDGVPPPTNETMRKLRDANPGWEYHYYNDDDHRTFIEKNMPEMLEAYDAINPAYGAARADLFRYIVIYVNGGVYLDIKSGMEPNRTLDDTIGKMRRLVLAHWNWCLPVPFNHKHDVGETTWIQREQRYVQTRNRIFARKLPTCWQAKEIGLVCFVTVKLRSEPLASVTAFLSWLAVVRPSRTTSSSDLKTTT